MQTPPAYDVLIQCPVLMRERVWPSDVEVGDAMHAECTNDGTVYERRNVNHDEFQTFL